MNGLNPLHILRSSPVSGGILLRSAMSGVTDNRHIATTDVDNLCFHSLFHFVLLQILCSVRVCNFFVNHPPRRLLPMKYRYGLVPPTP
jgi:hypothetical protein